MIGLIVILTFISAWLFFYNFIKNYFEKSVSPSRLKKILNSEVREVRQREVVRKDYKTGLNIISKTVRNLKFLEGYKKRILKKLAKANILLKTEEFITFCIILSAIFGVLTIVVTRGNVLVGMIFALLGWLFPSIILSMKMKKRLKRINDQLGDTINLISNSLKAGYSFMQAIDIVSKEMNGPVAEEFTILIKEINLGQPYEKALENLVLRVSSDDLELVVTAVLIQRQIGGNLAEILDNISTTIRERVKIKGEIKTVTAQGRMSGLVISLLPVLLCGILGLINPDHVKILFTDPYGMAILGYSIFMELLGIFFIKKIVNIEV